MKFLIPLLVPFLALAAANPLGDIAAREAAVVEARAVPRNCLTLPFLICTGGINQEIACGDIPWSCPGDGEPPNTSSTTCAADCVCEIPCP
ncbi:hypothetical protein K438DRAFT_1983555 [Mycena galopus ATCC 62051]|nr:hypothetical protein K438DRAFT_1983555 [Mycena galopus ATCC 62051]